MVSFFQMLIPDWFNGNEELLANALVTDWLAAAATCCCHRHATDT